MIRKYFSVLLITVLIILNIPFYAFADNSNDEVIVVKVGYSENYGMLKTPVFEGCEGYGYEYLHKISEYTDNNYKFEFVECSFDEGYELLRQNEIQILAPLSYTDDLAKEFVFSQQPFGQDSIFLTSLHGKEINENNYENINNSKIAVIKDDITVNSLKEFLKDYNINAEIIFIENDEYDDILSKEFDYFLADSMQMDLDLDITINLGVNDVFLLGNKQSKDIINDFDNAIELLSRNEYLYREKLYVKYFNHTINEYDFISEEEYQKLIDYGTFDVGVVSLYTTFGYSEMSDIVGLPYDIVNMLSDKGNMDIDFNKITDTTVPHIKNNFDFYLEPIGHIIETEKRTSDPYVTTPLLVLKKVDSNNKNQKTGVVSSYKLEEDVIDYLIPNQTIEYYSGISELCSAFRKGYIDNMLIFETSYNAAYTKIQNVTHTVEVSNYEFPAVITFSDEFPEELITIINKLISYIDFEAIEIASIKNASLLNDADKNNFLQIYLRAFIILGIIIIVILVQTNNNRDKELEKLSAIDDLTGLFTQRKFVEETKRLIEENEKSNYTLVCLDIDNFKYINEIYGYEIGSNILKKIANTIKENTDDTFPVARLSADNFLLLVSTDGLLNKIINFMKVDNQIYSELNELVSEHYSINFSIGSYDITDSSLDISYMIDCCNLAHSFSKVELGTTYKAFSEDMKVKESTKNSIIARMNQALKDKEFVVFYQPKFDIITQNITGAEGLVRWFSDGKMIPPNDFIPLFEQNGFIENLDYYVVERACEFIKENPKAKLPVLSVNLSGITIMKSDVVSRITGILDKYDISPKQIDLEITESAFVDHFEMAIESIDKFRDLGFTISMDDFGAGISSLNRLKEISIDILKIDREFIVGSLENEKGSTIIRNIILMAKDLKLETVAEGIETDEQLNFLRNLGCDVGQGYLFSRPLPEEDFLKRLREK